jgi:hypothetical protein
MRESEWVVCAEAFEDLEEQAVETDWGRTMEALSQHLVSPRIQ